MEGVLKQFQHLKIPLKEITSATNNFDHLNSIGGGGFGKVYEGEVSHSKGRSIVAIKRLDPKCGQGIPEFLKEIMMLSRYRHENLISLLGFCYEGEEMILVYEHASRGSLDRHLNSPHLMWSQRIKICLDAAKGLCYLHDPRESHQRLIHCDIKSSNILLDDQWNAKVSDFGLSITGPANEQHSVIVTFAAGTPGYCDPQYAMTHTLTKESDIYSFGVVLFEVLCGKLCYTYRNGHVTQILVPTWIESFKQNKLDDIIFKDPTVEPLDQSSLRTFSDIAYRCLKEYREDRPKIAEVVTELETALSLQELSEWKLHLDSCEEVSNTAQTSLNYSSKGELRKILSEGVLLNGSRTWFSLNKEGEHCVMISFAECLDSAPSEFESNPRSSEYNSRFVVAPYHYKSGSVKTHVKTQFLTPLITYVVNLVFKFTLPNNAKIRHRPIIISLAYKLQGETKNSISYFAFERDDGWWMCELYQLTSDQGFVDLEILFDGLYRDTSIEIEGIEFRPLEKVEHKDEKVDMQPISDSGANWKEKLPTDYEDIMKWTTGSIQWTTKKEAYSIIRKGFLIDDGEKWFSLDKNGKKCHMISGASESIHGWDDDMTPLPESRFGKALRCNSSYLVISNGIPSQLLSSETTYAIYLVYKLPKDQSKFEAPLGVYNLIYCASVVRWHILLASPQTPVIRPKAYQNTSNPLNKPKVKGLPRQRDDGWMEVQIGEFGTTTTATKMIPMHLGLPRQRDDGWMEVQIGEFGTTTTATEMIPMHLELNTYDHKHFSGLIIEGIELRPI